MARLNWDSLHCEWKFDYGGVLNPHKFTGSSYITSKYTEAVWSGIIQPMVLECEEDKDSLYDWFETGSKLVRCPVFYKAPEVIEDVTSYYDSVNKCIRWTDTPYSFSGGYYVGSNSDVNFNVVDPGLPVEWKMNIVPDNRGFEFVEAKDKLKVGAIPFKVLPRSY